MYQATLPERITATDAPAVRSALLGAGDYLHGLQRMAPADRGEGWQADVRSAVEFIHNYDAVASAIERGIVPPAGGPLGATAGMNPSMRSLGQLVSEDAQYLDLAGSHGASNARHAAVEVRGSLFNHNGEQFRTLVDSTVGSNGSGELLPQGTPFIPQPRQRRLFLRDVLSVQETGLSSVPYVREYNAEALSFGASSVAEGSAKAEVELTWDPDDAPVRKVAAWVPVTMEIIEDVPTLQGYIDTRLAYMLAVREEQQVLSGNGTSPNLKGILQYSGLQTQSYISGDPMASLGRGIGKIENVDGEPDAIAMNPTDFWVMATTRYANQFDGGFGGTLNIPFGAPPQNPWGLPVIRSRAITTGKALIGAFRMGATIFDRMQVTIRVGNQHSDFFTTNKVAILAEERIALAVMRPDFFCYTDVA